MRTYTEVDFSYNGQTLTGSQREMLAGGRQFDVMLPSGNVMRVDASDIIERREVPARRAIVQSSNNGYRTIGLIRAFGERHPWIIADLNAAGQIVSELAYRFSESDARAFANDKWRETARANF